MIRAARIASALLLSSTAQAVDLQWSAVDTAVDGTSIPALVIYYKVYWSADANSWSFAADTEETSINLDSITSGCYFFHVTAVRSDSDQESDPSQSLQYCYGDVGTEPPPPPPPPPAATVKPEPPTGVNVQ